MADHVVNYTARGSLEEFIKDIADLKDALKDLQGDYKKDTKAVKQNSRALKENEEALTDSQKAARGRKAALNGEKVAVEDLAAAGRVSARQAIYNEEVKTRASKNGSAARIRNGEKEARAEQALFKQKVKRAKDQARIIAESEKDISKLSRLDGSTGDRQKDAQNATRRLQTLVKNFEKLKDTMSPSDQQKIWADIVESGEILARQRKSDVTLQKESLRAAEKEANLSEREAARTKAITENRKRAEKLRKDEYGRSLEISRLHDKELAHEEAITAELEKQKDALKAAEQTAKQAEREAAHTQGVTENRKRLAKLRKDEYGRSLEISRIHDKELAHEQAITAERQRQNSLDSERAKGYRLQQSQLETEQKQLKVREGADRLHQDAGRYHDKELAHSKAITAELQRQGAIESDRALAYRRQQGQVAIDQARASNAAAAASAAGGGSSSTTAVGGRSKGSDGGFGKGGLLGGGGGGGVPGFYKLKSGAMGVAVLGIVSGLQALNSALFAVGGSVVVFAQALSQLGGIAATIPGGIFAVAGAVTASIFAFQGFGTAFKLFNKEFGPEAPQTYAEALNRLSPSGKKVVETFTGMSGKFREMKKDVQEATFAPIAKEIEKVNRLVPVLDGVLQTIGTSLGKVGAKFIKTFTTKAWQKSFKQLGDSSGKVIKSLGGGAVALASGFGKIAVAARPLTEFVGKTMKGLAKDFEGWTDSLSGDSFSTVGTRLTQFISIFKNLGSVVASTFRAAAPVTDWFMQRFTEVSKGWADTARNSGGLKKFFQELQPVMSATSKLFGEIFRQLAARIDLPGLVQVIEAIQGQLLPALLGVVDTFGDTENLLMFIELLSNAVETATAIFGSDRLTPERGISEISILPLPDLPPGVGSISVGLIAAISGLTLMLGSDLFEPDLTGVGPILATFPA